MKRHWTNDDFVVTYQTPGWNKDGLPNKYGYCAKCQCDMQQFGNKPIQHHKSHHYYKQYLKGQQI